MVEKAEILQSCRQRIGGLDLHQETVDASLRFVRIDILELTEKGKRAQLIPFSEASVLEIDFEGGTILIDPLAAGLINPEGDDDSDGADGKPGKGKG